MKRLIIGPSHVVRWERDVSQGRLPALKNVDFYGVGGLPVWDDKLFSLVGSSINDYDELIVIVGDFRFGNTFCFQSRLRHTGIEKKYINHQNDSFLFEKSVLALYKLSELPKVSFLFWDLALREYLNRKNKKYLIDGVYQHPIWNLEALERRFFNNTISIMDAISYDLNSFFIDSSLHPSVLGYEFLKEIILTRSVGSSILAALKLKKSLSEYFYTQQHVVICGNSKLYRAILMYFSKEVLSLPPNVSFSRADDALFCKRDEKRKLIFFTDTINEKKMDENMVFANKARWQEVVIVNSGLDLYRHKDLYEIDAGLPNSFFIISILNFIFSNESYFCLEKHKQAYRNLL